MLAYILLTLHILIHAEYTGPPPPSYYIDSLDSTEPLPDYAANQIRVLRNPPNQNRVLRHPRALGSGGGPFSALGSRLESARYSLS